MSVIEKVFRLKTIDPFGRLGYPELLALTDAARTRVYRPGERVAPAGQPLRRLVVVLDGSVSGARGRETAPVLGVRSLLFDAAPAEDLIASPESGATCLLISRGHFFRLLNEFPEVSVGLAASADGECPYLEPGESSS